MPKFLKGVRVYDNSIGIDHTISENNGKTTLALDMEIAKTVEGWRADIDFGQIPYADTPTEAVYALAEWMERISDELLKFSYDKIELQDVRFL